MHPTFVCFRGSVAGDHSSCPMQVDVLLPDVAAVRPTAGTAVFGRAARSSRAGARDDRSVSAWHSRGGILPSCTCVHPLHEGLLANPFLQASAGGEGGAA